MDPRRRHRPSSASRTSPCRKNVRRGHDVARKPGANGEGGRRRPAFPWRAPSPEAEEPPSVWGRPPGSRSSPGKGCVFTIDLPRQPPPPTSIHARPKVQGRSRKFRRARRRVRGDHRERDDNFAIDRNKLEEHEAAPIGSPGTTGSNGCGPAVRRPINDGTAGVERRGTSAARPP
jgi:hypothetical protein